MRKAAFHREAHQEAHPDWHLSPILLCSQHFIQLLGREICPLRELGRRAGRSTDPA